MFYHYCYAPPIISIMLHCATGGGRQCCRVCLSYLQYSTGCYIPVGVYGSGPAVPPTPPACAALALLSSPSLWRLSASAVRPCPPAPCHFGVSAVRAVVYCTFSTYCGQRRRLCTPPRYSALRNVRPQRRSACCRLPFRSGGRMRAHSHCRRLDITQQSAVFAAHATRAEVFTAPPSASLLDGVRCFDWSFPGY